MTNHIDLSTIVLQTGHPILAALAIRANDAEGTTAAQRVDIVRAGAVAS